MPTLRISGLWELWVEDVIVCRDVMQLQTTGCPHIAGRSFSQLAVLLPAGLRASQAEMDASIVYRSY